jgi:glycosyltransferase involved in cell wall biosynthesis
VSDNASQDDTPLVIEKFKTQLDLKLNRNPSNLGSTRNFLNLVSMADGTFVLMMGDDDLLTPTAIDKLNTLILNNPTIDYFYINSFVLDAGYLSLYSHPFNTDFLPKQMTRFTNCHLSGRLKFFDLIDPKVSQDCLGGIYSSLFRRQKWLENLGVLNDEALDKPDFSHLDNTFPHVKIFAHAFSDSTAYASEDPLVVCLAWQREWSAKGPLVMSIRLPEAVDELRKVGLDRLKTFKFKNYLFRHFIPHLTLMIINRRNSGIADVNLLSFFARNYFYPNIYLSLFYFAYRKFIMFVSGNRRKD